MEQRKFERFSIHGAVTFSSESLVGEGRLQNLSLGGAAIASDVVVSRGTYLKLAMTLPQQAATVEVELAPIRWVRQGSFGVEFIKITPAALQLLHRYIDQPGSVTVQPASSSL